MGGALGKRMKLDEPSVWLSPPPPQGLLVTFAGKQEVLERYMFILMITVFSTFYVYCILYVNEELQVITNVTISYRVVI